MTGPAISRRAAIASGLIVASAVAAHQASALTAPRARAYRLAEHLPVQISGYRQERALPTVLPDPEQEQAVARAYEGVLVRTYRDADGHALMLVVAHGQPDGGMLAVHRPEICYTAQGFAVEPLSPVALGSPGRITAARLFASHAEREEPVLYWATVAGEQTGLGLSQKLRIIQASLAGRPADSFLVRVSTFGPNNAESFARLRQFARSFLAAAGPATRADLGAV